MGVTYWSPNQHYRPRAWDKTRIVRIKGNNHDEFAVRDIVNNVSEHLNHTFLLFSSNLDDFYDVACWPINVIPVLHVSTQIQYNNSIHDYRKLRCPYHVLSIFCHEVVHIDPRWDWVFVSGSKYKNTRAVLNNVLNTRIPTYFEYYVNSRNVPDEFKHYQIPEQLYQDVNTPLLRVNV